MEGEVRIGGNSLQTCILDAGVILKGSRRVEYENEWDGVWEIPVYGGVWTSNTEDAATWGLR